MNQCLKCHIRGKNEVRDRGINSPEKMQGWRKENQIVMSAYQNLYLTLGLQKNSYWFCILLKTSRSFQETQSSRKKKRNGQS